MAKRKLYKICYYPTSEIWYYLDRRLAQKTYEALIKHEKENYPKTFSESNTDFEVCTIEERVVFQ